MSSLSMCVPYTYYPVTTTYSGVATSRCPNCGYCTCCGKADIPGKMTEQEDQSGVEQFGSSAGS